jgi:hypothetical protein
MVVFRNRMKISEVEAYSMVLLQCIFDRRVAAFF